MFSFMDGFPGYNQIKMAEQDQEKTAFTTQWGTLCYKVMPFGLKNAGSTYQRAMTTLFHDMMHRKIEVYVDDMIAKSLDAESHIVNLRKLFERLRKYRLRLNPAKCVFGATSWKLLGFIVSKQRIEVDPAKIKAIVDMPGGLKSSGRWHRLTYNKSTLAFIVSLCLLVEAGTAASACSHLRKMYSARGAHLRKTKSPTLQKML